MEYNFHSDAIRWQNIKIYKRILLHFFYFHQDTNCAHENNMNVLTHACTYTHTQTHMHHNKQAVSFRSKLADLHKHWCNLEQIHL